MKVSVVIPTFNRAHRLGAAIESVLSQTYQNFEVMVVDDGSTDGTDHLVARYGDRVRYFRQPNRGVSAARNAAIDRAAGDCIAFLDSDDWWFDFKLAVQIELLGRLPQTGFLFTEFEIRRDDGTRKRRGSRTWLARNVEWQDLYPQRTSARELGIAVPAAPDDFEVYAGLMYRHFIDEALVLPTTAIVRREALQGLRFRENVSMYEDWEFFSRLARHHACAFADVETAVNGGHDEPGRLTRCTSLQKAQCYLGMFERVWKADPEFRTEYPDVIRQVESRATLAVARTALLASDRRAACTALAQWRRIDGHTMRRRALTCAMLARMPFGRGLLRGVMLGEKLVRRAITGAEFGDTKVNPAA